MLNSGSSMNIAGFEVDDDNDPYPVTCARCGKAGTSATFELEEGNEWECPTCWEREEARINSTAAQREVGK